MKKPAAVVLLLGAALALVLASLAAHRKAPAAAAGGTVAYDDLVGRRVRIPRDVRRIVLLRSKDVYLLAALLGEDLPDRLAAWGSDLKSDDAELYRRLLERFPRLAEIPVTGDVYSDALDVEQLALLGADLILADKYMLDRGFAYTKRMDEVGLPVVYLDGSSDPLTGPQRGIRLLGRLLGREPRAEAVAEYMDRQVQLAVSRIASNAPPAPSVYLEAGALGPGGYGQCYGPGADRRQTSWGAILRALRVRNIAEGRVVGMAPIHPEALLAADPDIVVITGQNWTRYESPGAMRLGFNVTPAEARRLLEGFVARPGWNLLSAVKAGRVFSVFHNTVSPTVFSGVQALAKYCYPELFADVDPEANLKEFYGRFMPIAYDGTWMCGPAPGEPAPRQ